jgi:C4-type Zn-finger protein
MLKRNEKMEKNPSIREIKCPFCGRKKTVREMDEDIFYDRPPGKPTLLRVG